VGWELAVIFSFLSGPAYKFPISVCFCKNKEFSQHAAIAWSQPRPIGNRVAGHPGVLHVCVMCGFRKYPEIFYILACFFYLGENEFKVLGLYPNIKHFDSSIWTGKISYIKELRGYQFLTN
jgi:hypothetical protein